MATSCSTNSCSTASTCYDPDCDCGSTCSTSTSSCGCGCDPCECGSYNTSCAADEGVLFVPAGTTALQIPAWSPEVSSCTATDTTTSATDTTTTATTTTTSTFLNKTPVEFTMGAIGATNLSFQATNASSWAYPGLPIYFPELGCILVLGVSNDIITFKNESVPAGTVIASGMCFDTGIPEQCYSLTPEKTVIDALYCNADCPPTAPTCFDALLYCTGTELLPLPPEVGKVLVGCEAGWKYAEQTKECSGWATAPAKKSGSSGTYELIANWFDTFDESDCFSTSNGSIKVDKPGVLKVIYGGWAGEAGVSGGDNYAQLSIGGSAISSATSKGFWNNGSSIGNHTLMWAGDVASGTLVDIGITADGSAVNFSNNLLLLSLTIPLCDSI